MQSNKHSLTSEASLLPGQSVLAGGCVWAFATAKGSALHLPFIAFDSSALGENQAGTNSVDTLASPPIMSSIATGKWQYRWEVLNGPSSDVYKCERHKPQSGISKEV